MNFFGWLLGIERRDPYATRFSEALNEQGDYRIDYGDWRPPELSGDPLLVEPMRRRQGHKVSAELAAMMDMRAEAALQVLATRGFAPPRDKYDWELIEHELVRMAEPSVEPAHLASEKALMRPKYKAFLYDMGLLFARELIAACPTCSLLPSDYDYEHKGDYCSHMPTLVNSIDGGRLYPIRSCIAVGGMAKSEGFTGVLASNFDLLAIAETSTRIEPLELLLRFIADFEKDEMRPPTSGEIIDYMIDDSIDPNAIPADVARRYGIID